MARKVMSFYKEFYIKGTLSDETIKKMEKLYDRGEVESLYDIFKLSAESVGRDYQEGITLRKAQNLAVALAYTAKRFFVGDKPGLGKTAIASGLLALVRYKNQLKGERKLFLFVTDNNHVRGIKNDIKKFGLETECLSGGKLKVQRKLRDVDWANIDGLVLNWDTLKGNAFMDFYLECGDLFSQAIFDETWCLCNKNTDLFKVTKKIASQMEYVLFMNGTSYKKGIEDLINQFEALHGKPIITKTFVYDNYAVFSQSAPWWTTETVEDGFGGYSRQKKINFRKVLVDYRNQEEFKERCKFLFIARTKLEYNEGEPIPEDSITFYPVIMTKEQETLVKESHVGYEEILNSPQTRDPSYKVTASNVPKLKVLYNLIEQSVDDKPVIYTKNKAIQYTIKKYLTSKNITSEIINGDVNDKKRQEILDTFNKGELDCLLITVERAINITASNRLIFYSIPTVAARGEQISGRIDRNNYDINKNYDFLCYLNSPEMENLMILTAEREKHGSKFTGQETTMFRELAKQIRNYYSEEE